MSALTQLAILLGALAGAGLVLIVRGLVTSEPDLQDALDRLGTQRRLEAAPREAGDLKARVGLLVQHRTALASASWLRIPERDLALVRIPVHTWLGEKVLLAIVGLAFPPLASAMFALAGLPLPLLVPAIGSIALAGVLFLAPDLVTRRQATEAREAFARAVGAYIELVALERAGGIGVSQSLEDAAAVASSWPFERIREELLRARMSGISPWAGLDELADELGVPQLADLAGIMQRAGDDGAQVYDALRARGSGLRTELLAREQTRANTRSEQMVVPVSVLALIFVAILAAPAMIRILP